jgi:catechol 2,3-dioxygenase-like lactoylglutathione lyase family enzyme
VRVAFLDHVVLTVRDPSATVSFYERLGMRRETFGDRRLALRFGRQKLNVHTDGAEIAPHARQPTPGSADVCLLIEGSIAEAKSELEAAGVAIELGPVERAGAAGPLRSIYLRDPDGNLVELSEPLDGG